MTERAVLDCFYFDDKLMYLPNDLAVKTLLLKKPCNLVRQFGEKDLVICTRDRQTSQVVAPRANAAAINICYPYSNNSQLMIH
jgi:hypothetical protein